MPAPLHKTLQQPQLVDSAKFVGPETRSVCLYNIFIFPHVLDTTHEAAAAFKRPLLASEANRRFVEQCLAFILTLLCIFMSPRPILKRHPEPILYHQRPFPQPEPFPFAACSTVLLSPHVHFPPTPTLTSTFTTHSPTSYDRTPAIVPPNQCALPKRNERVLTGTSSPNTDRTGTPKARVHGEAKGSYFHPRAFEACAPEPSDNPSAQFHPPPLIPDVSSESDDSDGAAITPPDPLASPPISVHFAARHHDTPNPSIPRSHSQEEVDTALSFLPHPPSLVKEKERSIRRASSRARIAKGNRKEVRNTSAFAVPSLDFESEGCLGGF
ncbi:hypothetical protein BV22DRAFT_1032472 [Leucogyrophana mollusca]|uniref:Uncharacterized protein n=1 Tax=Leucogyrophana mollusca TaxID=85980 RepID=A0ACB8BNF9_9AGAM|nr:hypothetical protein BV22DRAFT_1032472 [Leucogyrophana mollusca]